jgi:hypothetical protein
MPTKTRPSTRSTPRSSPRFARTGTPPSSRGFRPRRPPQKSGGQKAIDALTKAIPGVGGTAAAGKASKGRRRSASKGGRGGKAGGVALVSAAAGLAFKNRSKLMQLLGRKGERDQAPAQTNPIEAGTRPTSGPVDPVRTGDIAPTDPGNRPDIPPV